MKGFFDENGRPKVMFTIEGSRKSGEIIALFDTGFSASLALPPQYLVELGSELVGVEPMTYADGRTSNELLFSVKIHTDGESKVITAHLISGAMEPIAGVQLFSPYIVLLNFEEKTLGLLRKEDLGKMRQEEVL